MQARKAVHAGAEYGHHLCSCPVCSGQFLRALPVQRRVQAHLRAWSSRTAFTCADNSDPVQCTIDPCKTVPRCPAGRQCISEYCGGCNYACLSKNPCPNGKPRRPCQSTASRCILTRCGFNSTCIPDQCNNCAARCVGPCRPGYYVSKNTGRCELCEQGYACKGGTEEPTPCNGGYYAPVRGLRRCKKCLHSTSTSSSPADKGYWTCSRVFGL